MATSSEPAAGGHILAGKKGLITGIANDQSIAYGCAKAFRRLGAEIAVTYLNDKARPHVEPLAQALDAALVLPLDVEVEGALESVFTAIAGKWGRLDFLLHSIAFAPKEDLHSPLLACSRKGFAQAMDISCHSFIRMAYLAKPLMTQGGALFTMSFYGAHRVVEHYNLMGPVKAALEASAKYLAAELAPSRIRVYVISPGPLRTRAASGITAFDDMLADAATRAPAGELVTIDDVGIATAALAGDGAKLITGQIIYVDGGLHIVG
ncbi:MAG TPA: enoyl-ACP reductase FabI [Acidocella sp.]|uniref:enoyl-ACP reductase FabI n=1 Tax=Acidocella sp. TaxID=50710 RepID=UPI002CA19055|nr:enoyl-ACP reductase FabI [Acidocella sp.]HVE21733.1 enoyl-ACP reductase FabI [Acidocella sp.]